MQTIALATGLDPTDTPALTAATALAIASGARLVTVHAAAGGPPPSLLPRPEELARGWGRAITCDSLVHTCCEDVTDTLLDALRRVAPDLVVLGTHQRGALAQLVSGSVAESVARNVRVPTLIVPLEGRGLADAATGVLDLRRIVVAAGDAEATRAGLLAAAWLARVSGTASAEVVLLHVDDGTSTPTLDMLPEGISVVRMNASGTLERELERVTRDLDACLVVMATRGHDGVLDTLLGSHTERVLRAVRCPTLAVPIGN